MPCTTILVGKKASYDGSTIIARNDDSGSGHYTSKKLAVIKPEEQPKIYKSVISHVEIELPENPMRYTAMPNAEEGEGIWAACGVNEAHVGMTATERRKRRNSWRNRGRGYCIHCTSIHTQCKGRCQTSWQPVRTVWYL